LAEGPVIDADVARRRGRLLCRVLDPPQQCVGAGRHVQVFGQPRAGLAAEGEANGAVGASQPWGSAGGGGEQRGQALAGDGLRAAGVEAAEAPDDQAQGNGPVVGWEIGDRTAVVAVDAVGRRAAARAGGGWPGRTEEGDSGGRGESKAVEAQAGTAGERVE